MHANKIRLRRSGNTCMYARGNYHLIYVIGYHDDAQFSSLVFYRSRNYKTIDATVYCISRVFTRAIKIYRCWKLTYRFIIIRHAIILNEIFIEMMPVCSMEAWVLYLNTYIRVIKSRVKKEIIKFFARAEVLNNEWNDNEQRWNGKEKLFAKLVNSAELFLFYATTRRGHKNMLINICGEKQCRKRKQSEIKIHRYKCLESL